jgi:PknH-like extracellular domain
MRYAIGVLALGLVLTGCSSNPPAAKPPAQLVPTSALNKLLLSTDDVNAVMGTRSLTPQSTDTTMADNRNLLPNLNCLGVWQVAESAIYGPSDGDHGWQGIRRQTLRTPDVDTWDTLAVQSVVYYPTAEAAGDFFAQSADRWSKCVNHHVNITLNDQPLPKWLSGDLGKTDTQLSMPITRGEGAEVRACQHVLERAVNLIIDVEACKSQPAPVTAAAELAAKIKAKLPS